MHWSVRVRGERVIRAVAGRQQAGEKRDGLSFIIHTPEMLALKVCCSAEERLVAWLALSSRIPS